MGIDDTEFESFEKQFLELVGEFQSITISENRLRESLRVESNRADSSESARWAAERAAAEAQASAAAATSGGAQATAALAALQDELASDKMLHDLAERERIILEEKCTELSSQVTSTERELQQLRPLQSLHVNLQRQYQELQDRVVHATDFAHKEAGRLESELRRVERSAASGAELRERARLAAAAHARERRLAAAELQHTAKELVAANADIARLNILVAELQCRLKDQDDIIKSSSLNKRIVCTDSDESTELRAALEAERAAVARLETALASALQDNVTLAAAAGKAETNTLDTPDSKDISALDSFLAD